MEDKKEWKTEEKSDIEIRDLSVTFQDGGEMIHAMEDVSAYFPSGSVAFRHVHPGTSLRAGPGGRKLYV